MFFLRRFCFIKKSSNLSNYKTHSKVIRMCESGKSPIGFLRKLKFENAKQNKTNVIETTMKGLIELLILLHSGFWCTQSKS